VSEVETDVAPGLPEHLPLGETVLWQGKPDWRSLAIRAFHARKMAIYCSALMVWRLASDIAAGLPAGEVALGMAYMLPLMAAGVGIPAALGWLYARSTIYTVTSQRVVMRIGAALPMTLNLPFRGIGNVAVRRFADGTGDLPLALLGKNRIAYLHLWPHARPWRVAKPEPMLRCVPDAQNVAAILAQAMSEAVPGKLEAVAAPARPVAAPKGPALAPTAAAA
jgi:hypothetical protein